MSDQTQAEDQAQTEADFAAHQRTFDRFIFGAKWTTIAVAAVLIGMAFGFFAGGGFFGGLVAFILVMIVAVFIL